MSEGTEQTTYKTHGNFGGEEYLPQVRLNSFMTEVPILHKPVH